MLTKIEQDVFAILSELYSNAYILLIDLMETTEHRDGFRKIGRGFWLSIGDIFSGTPENSLEPPGVPSYMH